MNVADLIKLIWPYIVIQLGLQIYCIYDVIKKGKTKNLSMPIWIIIIIFGEILGSIIYLLIGRSEE